MLFVIVTSVAFAKTVNKANNQSMYNRKVSQLSHLSPPSSRSTDDPANSSDRSWMRPSCPAGRSARNLRHKCRAPACRLWYDRPSLRVELLDGKKNFFLFFLMLKKFFFTNLLRMYCSRWASSKVQGMFRRPSSFRKFVCNQLDPEPPTRSRPSRRSPR